MDYGDKSEWNDAASYTQRINAQLWAYNLAGTDLAAKMDALEVLFSEVYPFVRAESRKNNAEEKEFRYEQMKKLKTDIYKQMQTNKSNKNNYWPSELYWRVYKFNLFIRTSLKTAGLLTRVSDDPRFAIGG